MELTTKVEVWTDVAGYEELYKISTLGRVKNCLRQVKHSKGGLQILKERVLKPNLCKSGYSTVALSKNGKSKTFHVHRLVAIGFLQCKSSEVVDHVNGKKSDNWLFNLKVCSQRDNLNNPNNKKKSKAGYVGVTINPECYAKRFRARIRVNKKLLDLGSFPTAKEAGLAYLNFKQQL